MQRALREYRAKMNKEYKHYEPYDLVVRDFSIIDSFGLRAKGNLYCKFKYKWKGKTYHMSGEHYLGKTEIVITYKYFIMDVKTWWVTEKHRPVVRGRRGTTMPSLYTITKKGSMEDLCMYADLRLTHDSDQTFTDMYKKYYTKEGK